MHFKRQSNKEGSPTYFTLEVLATIGAGAENSFLVPPCGLQEPKHLSHHRCLPGNTSTGSYSHMPSWNLSQTLPKCHFNNVVGRTLAPFHLFACFFVFIFALTFFYNFLVREFYNTDSFLLVLLLSLVSETFHLLNMSAAHSFLIAEKYSIVKLCQIYLFFLLLINNLCRLFPVWSHCEHNCHEHFNKYVY